MRNNNTIIDEFPNLELMRRDLSPLLNDTIVDKGSTVDKLFRLWRDEIFPPLMNFHVKRYNQRYYDFDVSVLHDIKETGMIISHELLLRHYSNSGRLNGTDFIFM